MKIEDLAREDLIKLVQMYAKNWLAHDGCWFLAVEEKFGMEIALELDAQAWTCFSPVEARRIMQTFAIPEGGGLDALEKALGYRLYATVNRQTSERVDDTTLRFRMVECRVQQARQRKGLPSFLCKAVGLVEYAQFARTIDPRIETVCLYAPPDTITDSFCVWEFRLATPISAGNVMVKVVPFDRLRAGPGPNELATAPWRGSSTIWPPCAVINWRAIARPNPAPPPRRLRLLSPR